MARIRCVHGHDAAQTVTLDHRTPDQRACQQPLEQVATGCRHRRLGIDIIDDEAFAAFEYRGSVMAEAGQRVLADDGRVARRCPFVANREAVLLRFDIRVRAARDA